MRFSYAPLQPYFLFDECATALWCHPFPLLGPFLPTPLLTLLTVNHEWIVYHPVSSGFGWLAVSVLGTELLVRLWSLGGRTEEENKIFGGVRLQSWGEGCVCLPSLVTSISPLDDFTAGFSWKIHYHLSPAHLLFCWVLLFEKVLDCLLRLTLSSPVWWLWFKFTLGLYTAGLSSCCFSQDGPPCARGPSLIAQVSVNLHPTPGSFLRVK